MNARTQVGFHVGDRVRWVGPNPPCASDVGIVTLAAPESDYYDVDFGSGGLPFPCFGTELDHVADEDE